MHRCDQMRTRGASRADRCHRHFLQDAAAGYCKTRLSPPLRPEECAALSACFIRDLAGTIHELTHDGDVTGYAVFTPVGTEGALRALLPPGFRLLPQCEGDFGTRLAHRDARPARDPCRRDPGQCRQPDLAGRDPARGGRRDPARRRGGAQSRARWRGYTLIGVSRLHERLYAGHSVEHLRRSHPKTRRACGRDRPAGGRTCPAGTTWTTPPRWRCSKAELAGEPSALRAGLTGAPAPATRAHFAARAAPLRAGSAR